MTRVEVPEFSHGSEETEEGEGEVYLLCPFQSDVRKVRDDSGALLWLVLSLDRTVDLWYRGEIKTQGGPLGDFIHRLGRSKRGSVSDSTPVNIIPTG